MLVLVFRWMHLTARSQSAALVMWRLPLETRGKALCDDVASAVAAAEAPAETEELELLPRHHAAEA